jgi:hypothetical protein
MPPNGVPANIIVLPGLSLVAAPMAVIEPVDPSNFVTLAVVDKTVPVIVTAGPPLDVLTLNPLVVKLVANT